MMNRKVLIVDDEKPARTKITHFINKCDPLAQISEVESGQEAVERIQSQSVDMLFLDIQMPEMNGFEVIYNIGIENMPPYIFATAYDEYAIQAFEANAIDYLLKPFTYERFLKSYKRLQQHTSHITKTDNSMLHVMEYLQSKKERFYRLAIRDKGKICMVDPRKIIYIESDEQYVRYHLADKQLYERQSLKSLLTKLTPYHFRQIHRSFLINPHYLREIEPLSHGDYSALMENGKRLTISRRYFDNLEI